MPQLNIQKIGKYEIQAELGQGGFGRVYRAFDPTVGRLVAIKVLTTEGNPDLLTRFRNEATSTGNLKHKNIVTVYEFGEHKGQPFLVMEFLEGEDLLQVINSGRRLTLLEKMNIMDQVADGLEGAHRSGVVHRDVKPANIRLLPDGTVKIMDFGIARIRRDRDATRLTQQGDLIGTILYMSPEQFAGSEADALCDIFAYGVTYFELLTGRHPFRSPDPRVVMFKITMEDAEPIRTLVPDCPEGLEHVLNRALQKDRELRYQSLRDLRADAAPLKFELEQERARQLVAEAQQVSSAKEPQPALTLVQEALNLDPSNREARHLRESLTKQIQRDALSPRVEAMFQAGQKHVESRSLARAIQMFESALKLDQSHAGVRAALEIAREELQRSKEAARLAGAALADAKRGEWLGASEKASQAARLDPSSTEAKAVLARVEKHVWDVLSEMDGLIAQGDFDSAIGGLKDLASLRPEAKEVEHRLAEATASKLARDWFQAVMQEARHRIDQSQFSEAIEVLAPALRDFPDEPGLLSLRAQAENGLITRRRLENIERTARAAEALLQAARFDDALLEIETALASYPADEKLVELRAGTQVAKAFWERGLLVQTAAQECNRLRSESRFAEALEVVQAALRRCGEEPALVDLQQVVRTEREGQQRAEAILQWTGEGRRLLEQGRFEQAFELLRNAIGQYPEEPELKPLLAEAQQRMLVQERREAVEKAAGRARGRVEEHDFAGAISILEEALKSWPGESLLADLLRKTQDAKAYAERQRAVDDIAQRCDRLAQSNRFPEALEAVRAGLRQYLEEPALVEIQQRLEREFARQQRVEAVHQKTEEVRQLLEHGQPEQAVDVLRKACSQYPEEAGLKRLLAEAQEQALAKQRRAAVEQPVAEAQGRIQRRDFQGAIEVLERALESWPGESQLMDLLQSTRDSQRAHEELERRAEEERKRQQRAESVRKKIEEGRLLLEQGRPKQALEALRKASIDYPEQEGIQQLLAEAQKRVAVEGACGEARERVEKRDFKGAVQALEQDLKSFPGEPALADLLRKTRDGLREYEERQRAVAGAVRQCEQFAKGNRFGEALEALQAGLRKYPDEPVLVELYQRTLKERERQQHAEAVVQRIEEGRRLLEQGRLEQAEATLREACKQYPEEEGFKQLLAEARQGLLARLRREAVEKEAGRAEDRAAQQDFQGAVAILEQALKSWPGESRLVELLQKTREAQAHAARLKVEKALAQAQASLRDGRIEDAITSLRRTAAQHPGESQVSDLLRSAEEELRRQQREREQESVRSHAEALLLQAKPEQVIALIESRYSAEPRFAELITRARKALDEKQLRELLQTAGALRGDKRFTEALQLAEQAISQYGAPAAAVELKQNLQDEIERQRRREMRQAEHARLLEIEREVQARISKRKLAKRGEDVQRIAVAYSADKEIASIAARVRQRIESALLEPPTSPWPSRKSAGIAAAAALVTIGIVLFLFRITTTAKIPVEIRSDPQGASVRVGGRTCVTPACRFDLPPGTYQVEAQLNGYTTAQQAFIVDAKKPFSSLDLTMQPLPAQPSAAPVAPAPIAPAVQPTPPPGTLIVRTGISGALVFIDNVPRGRTDERGAFSLPIEGATHRLRVEKTGYQTPREQQVKIASNSSQAVTLSLTPQPAQLELRGAPAGIELRVGDSLLGRTDGSGTFSRPVQPGDQTLKITDGSARRQIAQRFEPGQVVTLDWQNVAPPKAPPQPDPRQIEAQDWERVRTSISADTIDDFIRRHPDGAHAEEARSRAAQLRQQLQAAAARQADQTAWDATDRNRRASLQDYLSRFGNGAHATEARALIAGIDKQEADALTAQRAKEQKDKELQDKELGDKELKDKGQEVASRAAAEEQAITRVIGAYEAAYNAKDLKALQGIWSGMSKATVDAIGSTFRNARSITFQLRPLGRPETNGNSVTVNCARSLSMTVPGQRIPTADDRVRVTLERTAAGWVIRSMTPY